MRSKAASFIEHNPAAAAALAERLGRVLRTATERPLDDGVSSSERAASVGRRIDSVLKGFVGTNGEVDVDRVNAFVEALDKRNEPEPMVLSPTGRRSLQLLELKDHSREDPESEGREPDNSVSATGNEAASAASLVEIADMLGRHVREELDAKLSSTTVPESPSDTSDHGLTASQSHVEEGSASGVASAEQVVADAIQKGRAQFVQDNAPEQSSDALTADHLDQAMLQFGNDDVGVIAEFLAESLDTKMKPDQDVILQAARAAAKDLSAARKAGDSVATIGLKEAQAKLGELITRRTHAADSIGTSGADDVESPAAPVSESDPVLPASLFTNLETVEGRGYPVLSTRIEVTVPLDCFENVRILCL